MQRGAAAGKPDDDDNSRWIKLMRRIRIVISLSRSAEVVAKLALCVGGWWRLVVVALAHTREEAMFSRRAKFTCAFTFIFNNKV